MDTHFIPILCYHRIVSDERAHEFPSLQDVPESVFADQMRYLYEHDYSVLSVDDFLSGDIHSKPKRKQVVITFDDGYRDFAARALPHLERYGFHATIFLVTRYADEAEDELHLPLSESIMTWDEARALQDHGITFGSHTHNHPDLSTLSSKEVYEELAHSKHRLQVELDREIPIISYPYGQSNKTVREHAKAAGYRAAFGVRSGMPGRYNVWRRLHGSRPLGLLPFYLSPWYVYLQLLRQRAKDVGR